MKENHAKTKEYVEAVPGPAFIISKKTYNKMQQSQSQKRYLENVKKYEKLFQKIKDKSNKEELTL